MMWFEPLMGFREASAEQVRRNVSIVGDKMMSRVNGRQFVFGRLEIPDLAELRQRVRQSNMREGRLQLSQVVADVQQLHRDPGNRGALFQVASQFNLLEMVSPSVTPEQGVDIYSSDPTQGPACAIACGAGTIYRNYFVNVDGQTGQSADHQIDCLRDLGQALGNAGNRLWTMRNGYALATADGLSEISRRLHAANESERDALRQLLRIGIQWQTQVTIGDLSHTVTQAYCSALPVTYSVLPDDLWADFARLVLEASYEAALCGAVLNAALTGNNRVFLTLLGGGAFGNRIEWIMAALTRALRQMADHDLNVAVVSYRSSHPAVESLVRDW